MTKVAQPQATSQDVTRRAGELQAMNGNGVHAKPASFWLEIAQAEADEGRTQVWLWLCDGNMLAHLEARYDATILNHRTGENRSELFAQIVALRAKIAADTAKATAEAVEAHHVPAAPVAKSAYSRLELMVLRRHATAWSADGSKTAEVVVTGTLEQAEQAACVAFLQRHGEHAHDASATHKPKRRAA
jgi:hypothetical protein